MQKGWSADMESFSVNNLWQERTNGHASSNKVPK